MKANPTRAPREPGTSAGLPARARLGWSDFHLVLLLARNGHTVRAASQLAMSHVTLLRKLAAIEARLGARLFDRERGRCTATAAGEELIAAAEAMAPLAQRAETRVLGQDLRPSGLVRITAASIVVGHLLPPLLADFGRAYPEVTLELLATRQHLSLQRREADVALRISDRVPEWLVGRALAALDFRVYGLRKRGAKTGLLPLPDLLAQRRWISFEHEARELKFDRWLDQHVPAASVVLRVDSFDHALAMVRAGLGLAVLPDFLRASCPELLPLSEPIAALRTPLWLITHRELRDTMRIRVVMQALGPALQRAVGVSPA
jgi:DNA-binding transcriptional LysR family regulator